jgi:glycerophosphoryl diester phosphodiesterase
MFKSLKTPVIIGHRGASLHSPENTLAAFKLAVDRSAVAIEFDVKLTRDQQVVVIHDPNVARTTDGQGLVSKLTLEEIKRLDAGSWFSSNFKGERIPILEEVFNTVGMKLFMNIELTNYTTPSDPLVSKVVEIVKKKGMEDRVYFSSFLAANLVKARALLPDCGIGYLIYAGPARVFQRIFQSPPRSFDSLNPYRGSVTQKMIDHEHELGRRVLAYTVNDPAEMQRLFKLGVDGIFTDDPLTGNKIASEFHQIR